MKKALSLIALIAVVAGCAPSVATLQQYSAGQTGCVPSENVISNQKPGSNLGSWSAQCKDKTYLCTNLPNGPDNYQTSCAVAK